MLYRVIPISVLGVVVMAASFYSGAEIAAAEKSTVAMRAERKLPAECEKALADCDLRAREHLDQVEQRYRKFLREVRTKQNLRPFVGELLGIMEKFEMGKDLVNNRSDSEKRIRALFRKQVFDDEEFARIAGDFVEQFSRFLVEQDTALLIRFKIDRDVPARQLSRTRIDITKFRARISSVINIAVTAAQTDVARFAANFVASEVLASGAKEVARGAGLLPEDDDSVASVIGGLFLDIVVGAALDEMTDPTDQIIQQLQYQLASAETVILDGTDKQPGLFRLLRQAAVEHSAARRKVLIDHFGK